VIASCNDAKCTDSVLAFVRPSTLLQLTVGLHACFSFRDTFSKKVGEIEGASEFKNISPVKFSDNYFAPKSPVRKLPKKIKYCLSPCFSR
jgi:hypothetical protein